MKRLICIFLLLIGVSAYAQVEEDITDGSFKDRVFVGGALGLQFGTITNVEVSPLVGYRFNNQFSAGLGITYIYLRQEIRGGEDFETNIYGFRSFARYNITPQFYATAEYENLSLEFFNSNDFTIRREWVPGGFFGGGYFQPIGRRSGLNVAVLYNVLHDDLRSPYNSPWVFRIGVTAGF